MSAHFDVVMVAVSYRAEEDTRRLVARVDALVGQSLRERELQVALIIVDNSSASLQQSPYRELSAQSIAVITLSRGNLGYFGACRAAHEWACEQKWSWGAWILSNTDLEILSRDFFSKLAEIGREARADLAVIGPRIMSELSGRDQNPFMRMRPSRARMGFYRWCFAWRPLAWLYQWAAIVKARLRYLRGSSSRREARAHTDREVVYAVQGAMMIYLPAWFRAELRFDHGAFLYGEEITTAERARRTNLMIEHWPELEVKHREHGSIGLRPSSRMLNWQAEASRFVWEAYFRS